MRFTTVTVAVLLGFSGCAAPTSTSLPPTQQTNDAPTARDASQSSGIQTDAQSQTISLSGKVSSVVTGMFTMNGGPGIGYVHVYTSGATFSGLYLKAGTYAAVVGTGSASTSIHATSINVTNSAQTSTITLSGPVESVVTGMFTMNAGAGLGLVNVYTAGASWTGLYLKAGTYAKVTGTGSASTSVHAITIAVSSAPPGSGSSVATHVLTADYLGGADGTHSITWGQAAPYLTWAETDVADANAIHAAGIKTMMYVDPNREQPGSQMWTTNTAAYAHDCSGNRVTDLYNKSVTQYVTSPTSSAMQSVFASYVRSIAAQAHFDALFEDDSGPLSAFAPYDPFSAMPCGYTDAAWIAGEIALNQASPLPIVVNGLSGLNGHQPSLTLGILKGTNTIGGDFEQCYASDSQPKMDGWLWLAIENSALQAAAENKIFECMAANTAAGGSSTDARIFAYASFLMTYNPNTSVYRTTYATPSGLHIFPEMGLVALNPTVAAPLTVASLEQSGGTYARQYGACYLRGSLIGPCAVLVNPNQSGSLKFPFTQYHHRLALTGSGTLDGGSASAAGPAPPASLGPEEAVIAFP